MNKPLVIIAVAAVAAVAVVTHHRSEPVEVDAAANRLLADRIWIDHVPKNERDTIHAFAALSEHAVGVFQATSQWRGAFEAFRYEASGAELRLLYPQTGEREAVRAKARRCTEHQMDYCLDVEGASRGVKRYYSREGWEIRHGRDLDAVAHQIDALRVQLTTPD